MGPDVRHGRARPIIAALDRRRTHRRRRPHRLTRRRRRRRRERRLLVRLRRAVDAGRRRLHRREPRHHLQRDAGLRLHHRARRRNGFRDRGGDDLLKRDFTIANNQAFAVDVPNGTYEVTTWAGDLIAGNGTNFDVEGTAFAGPRTSTGVVHEQFFPAITVSDGQLNVRVTGGDGRVNGIRVQTPLAAPAGLAASDIDAVNEVITLGWQPVTDATGYVVFRAPTGRRARRDRPHHGCRDDDASPTTPSRSASPTTTPSRR